jgi:hypothetical protein
VGELETYNGAVNYLSEDIFISNGLLITGDYETYTTPQSHTPEERKRVFNSRLPNTGAWDPNNLGDPGATLVFSASPFLVCQLESMLDDRDKVTGQGAINALEITSTGGSYGYADLEDTGTKLDYNCILRWSHVYDKSNNYGEYFWRLL